MKQEGLFGELASGGRCQHGCGCTTAPEPTYTLCVECKLDLCGDGGQSRQEGKERALAAASAEWLARATAEIEKLARLHIAFTSEHITIAVGLPRTTTKTNRNNAVGALMSNAARCGLIVKTGRYVPSQKRRSHGAMLAEWRGA